MMQNIATPRRPRARAARAEDAQDRARGLSPRPSTSASTISRSATPQRLLVTVEVWVDEAQLRRRATSAASAWDYDFLRTEIGALAEGRRFNLQETFVREIYDLVAARRGVTALRVSTRKPDIYPDCAGVGVELASF